LNLHQLDDGAYFLEALNEIKGSWSSKLAIVEQTTRGLIKIRDRADLQSLLHRFPVINVAESRPKKEIEPRYIAENAITSLRKTLKEMSGSRCLVTGYGSIGKAVATTGIF
jgi:S-adenosylhomocysteine hydrolase